MDLPVLPNNPFLFVGNQAALDFVNTDLVLDGNPTDLLPSIEALISWSIQAGLITKEEAKRIEQAGGRHDAETLKQHLHEAEIAPTPRGLRIEIASEDEIEAVLAALRKVGGKIVSVRPVKQSLEELFL